ncbi:hypothetical protein PoMZ_02781 [Pyricularia oryzae]|uniref:Uncharacterized protein n=1 Tax=Pyricularia oryzae TaxID=318829 RepID=A0A4P7N9Y9_PYROR|nr:hypothetical protein PoMZ_02781 [Pyricularia oryzae]
MNRPASKDKSAITAATPWRGTILFPLPLIPGTSRNAQGPVLSVLGRPGARSRWCNTRIYNGYRGSGQSLARIRCWTECLVHKSGLFESSLLVIENEIYAEKWFG